jgi:hypothetical protein
MLEEHAQLVVRGLQLCGAFGHTLFETLRKLPHLQLGQLLLGDVGQDSVVEGDPAALVAPHDHAVAYPAHLSILSDDPVLQRRRVAPLQRRPGVFEHGAAVRFRDHRDPQVRVLRKLLHRVPGHRQARRGVRRRHRLPVAHLHGVVVVGHRGQQQPVQLLALLHLLGAFAHVALEIARQPAQLLLHALQRETSFWMQRKPAVAPPSS